MTEGTANAAGASPSCRSYDDALETYQRACEKRRTVADRLAEALQQYVAAINAMPLPDLMQGDRPTVTDADSLDKVRSVLAMGVTDDARKADAEERLASLVQYRKVKAELGTEHRVDELGKAALAAAQDEDSAFAAFLCVQAPTIQRFALKLELAAITPWRLGDHLVALAADARRLANLETSVASAWIDRWTALGGGFCRSRNMDGTDRGALRSIPMSYTWTPPAQQNPLLQPHEWIVEESDHTGAVKVLDGFLSLVPGLSDAVFAVAAEQGLLAKDGEFSHAA